MESLNCQGYVLLPFESVQRQKSRSIPVHHEQSISKPLRNDLENPRFDQVDVFSAEIFTGAGIGGKVDARIIDFGYLPQ